MIKSLQARSNNKCELCASENELNPFKVEGSDLQEIDTTVLLCKKCSNQISEIEPLDTNHWRLLHDSIWSPIPAIQVLSWRILHQLQGEEWTHELLNMMYLDEKILIWAKSGLKSLVNSDDLHKDCHGAVLEAGDTVHLIKDLQVKGAGFTAKRGTAIRRISLVIGNPDQIEGRVNEQQLVILTQFVKKSS